MADLPLQPRYLTIHHKDTVLIVDRDGWIAEARSGLFKKDTRYLAAYRLTLNGVIPRFLGMAQPYYFAQTLYYTNQNLRTTSAAIADNSLLLTIRRHIRDGLREDIELTNFSGGPVGLSLVLSIRSDFADIFQVRGVVPAIRRSVQTRWDDVARLLTLRYRKQDFSRCLRWKFQRCDSQPRRVGRTIEFVVNLAQGQVWRASSTISLDDQIEAGLQGVDSLASAIDDLREWEEETTSISSPVAVVGSIYKQAVVDLAALRLEDVSGRWFPAAGVPWYAAVFGRDSLIVALQAAPANTSIGDAVLNRLARQQSTSLEPSRDQEPGRLPHELRCDELTHFGRLPYSPYYGTVDAPLLYVILLHELYRFVGDQSLLDRHLPAARACLEWARTFGDVDGDGFVEYRPLTAAGYRHQSWKDAGDAVVYPDGSPVDPPIAIIEVQGYYYDALRRMSDISRSLGHHAEAEAYETRASDLATRLNASFWVQEDAAYAFGLDATKRPIRTLASNAGHLLWSRAVPRERAGEIAGKLLDPQMFSGWGIRTLTNRNPAFSPLSYQRGSVWPHDNAVIALGLKQYGLWEEANRIAGAIFDVAARYERHSLPEVFAGIERTSRDAPIPYAEANVPQAWAAGAVPMLLRAMLGLEPQPDRHRLIVSPTLPEWLPEVTVRNLRVLGCRLDLRFAGGGPTTRVDVLKREGKVEVEQVAAGSRLDFR